MEITRYHVSIDNGDEYVSRSQYGKYVRYDDAMAMVTAITSQLESVAAENAKLADCANFYRLGFKPVKGVLGIEYRATEQLLDDCGNTALEAIKTPATDAFLAEVRASARNEGINYAAGRLSAAFNAGFVDKPLAEVCDVVRMILDAKEDLANSRLPADDGLSGEYAENFLAEFASQLRQGGSV